MPRNINWPTREEWQAKGEYAARTQCYTWQRVSTDPAEWLTADELTEARSLAVAVVKATRTALTRAGRGNERPALNEHGRAAARDWADVNDLTYDWGRITSTASSVGAAPEQTARLAALSAAMVGRRDNAADEALETAIAREVAERATEEGWQKEVQRRARIDRGPMLTTITVHGDGTSTVGDPEPYREPGRR